MNSGFSSPPSGLSRATGGQNLTSCPIGSATRRPESDQTRRGSSAGMRKHRPFRRRLGEWIDSKRKLRDAKIKNSARRFCARKAGGFERASARARLGVSLDTKRMGRDYRASTVSATSFAKTAARPKTVSARRTENEAQRRFLSLARKSEAFHAGGRPVQADFVFAATPMPNADGALSAPFEITPDVYLVGPRGPVVRNADDLTHRCTEPARR
jgi:hypothetical protein